MSSCNPGWDRPWKHDEKAVDDCRERGAESAAKAESVGRWPANVVLDDASAAALDAQSGILTSGNNPSKRSADKHRKVYAGWKGEQCLVHRGTDSGGASRFFYCAKAKGDERKDNEHPTVKALALTEWLATLLLTPGAQSLLVPYSGSGSEMIGAIRAGWPQVTGIEREAAYITIAARRLQAEGITTQHLSIPAEARTAKPTLFDIIGEQDAPKELALDVDGEVSA